MKDDESAMDIDSNEGFDINKIDLSCLDYNEPTSLAIE